MVISDAEENTFVQGCLLLAAAQANTKSNVL